jgi:hypothetical protein
MLAMGTVKVTCNGAVSLVGSVRQSLWTVVVAEWCTVFILHTELDQCVVYRQSPLCDLLPQRDMEGWEIDTEL